MRKGLKKVLAGLLVGAMALCAGAPAFAADGVWDETESVQAEFYAYYDSDDDGTSEWAPAPKGMNTGCIGTWTYDAVNNRANVDITSFTVMGVTGTISDISGAAVVNKTVTDSVVTNVVFNTNALTTVPGTDLQGVPASLTYTALYGLMTKTMDVYFVIY